MNIQKKSFSAVFVTDSSDWMWALSFECALELKNAGHQVLIVDLSKRRIRRFKVKANSENILRDSVIKKLEDFGILYSPKRLKITRPILRICDTVKNVILLFII